MVPDVNVLVAATRPDHLHHAVAMSWLEDALRNARHGDRLVLLPTVVAGYLRVATNPRIWVAPMPIRAACEFVDDLLQQPGVEMLGGGSEWRELRALCLLGRVSGNRVQDAWIAAIVIRVDDVLATFDRGFRQLLEQHRLVLLGVSH